MIKLKDLVKSYRHKHGTIKVLDEINIEVNAGEVFGIIGKSGAGKSTLLKCLNLLELPDHGSVIIDGVDLTSLKPRELRAQRQQIGVIFQHFNLLNSKTIFANVALPLTLQGKHSKAQIESAVFEMLELVGLAEFAHKYPAALSGGQKQRVGIARALITKPKLLLSDEATSALDPQTTNNILELLLEINQKLGITIVLITHELEVVRKICDKVAVIDSGKIIEQGDAFNVLLHPKHPTTRKLIIEEDSEEYLNQIQQFYQFDKHQGKHLLLLSFVGEKTYTPLLNKISRGANVEFSILRGELGRIKHMPFGQLLVEFEGAEDSLNQVTSIMDEHAVHYEIVR
jgi:D-methionine transport system ATP-binding protein